MSFILLTINIMMYSFFAVLFYYLRKYFSLIPFYLYLGVLEVLVSLLNSVYLIQITSDILIGGGNVVYSALIWSLLFFYLMERDQDLIRFIIYCLIILQLFFFFLYPLLYFLLQNNNIINPLNTSINLFSTSFWIFIIGNFLQLFEAFGMIFLIEKSDRAYPNISWEVRSIIIYIFILVIDGILFPLLAFPITQSISVVQGFNAVIGKLILGILYSITLVITIVLIKPHFDDKEKVTEFNLIKLVSLPKAQMIRKIRTYKENEEMIRLLLGLLRHDIKNYNQNTILRTDTILESTSNLTDQEKQLLLGIKRLQFDSASLVDNIINLNKAQTGVIKPEVISVNDCFQKALMKAKVTNPQIEIKIINQEVINDINVQAHPLLTDIFFNLISNSIKFRKENSIVEIDLSIKYQSENIVINIGDKGKGISENEKTLLFNYSFNEEKRGISLFIVSRIIDTLKGSITVQNRFETPSNYKEGTVFSLSFKNPNFSKK